MQVALECQDFGSRLHISDLGVYSAFIPPHVQVGDARVCVLSYTHISLSDWCGCGSSHVRLWPPSIRIALQRHTA